MSSIRIPLDPKSCFPGITSIMIGVKNIDESMLEAGESQPLDIGVEREEVARQIFVRSSEMR
jgi:hypothetical protein